jgi:hypothetical protein
MKKGVGQGTADPGVKEDKHRGDFGAVVGQAIAVAPAVSLQEAVRFHLPQVVPELRHGVRLGGERKCLEDGGVNLGRPPAGELRSAVQQDLHQAQQARVLDLDARDFRVARRCGLGQLLKQGEVDMDVEEVGFEGGQPIGHDHQFVTERRQLLEPLVQPEILEPIDADFDAEEGPEFFVQAGDEAFAVHPQHMVAVVDRFQHAVELAAESRVFPDPKDLGDDVGGQPEYAQFAGAFEDLVNREMAPKDEIATVLDLVQGVLASEMDGGPILLENFGPSTRVQ